MLPRDAWVCEGPSLHLADWGGRGSGILLVHGMAGNAHWWDSVAPRLAVACRPVALDLRGHGDSEPVAPSGYEMDGFAQDIESARAALGWESMLLAGHSLGARVSLHYANRHPGRLSGLIAVDFLPERDQGSLNKFQRASRRRRPVYPALEPMLEKFRLEPSGTLLDEPSLRKLGRLCIRRIPAGFVWKFDWKVFGHRLDSIWPLLPGIRTPTLFLRGENSAIMSDDDLSRVLRETPGSTGGTVPRAHHHVPLDVPEDLCLRILGFLERLQSPSRPTR